MPSSRRPPEDDENLDMETQVVVAWPGPNDPPPRPVRLPGMRIDSWPQADGSVLYEIKYRGQPYSAKKKRRRHRDTLSMIRPDLPDEEK